MRRSWRAGVGAALGVLIADALV